MASALADKIKQTQSSFPSSTPPPGAVAACPLAGLIPQEILSPQSSPAPAELKIFPAETDLNAVPPPVAPKKEEEQKKAWVEIILVDMEGRPMPGVRYRITPPAGGEPKEGVLNEHGQAGYHQIEPGNCKITFPDLDKDAWD